MPRFMYIGGPPTNGALLTYITSTGADVTQSTFTFSSQSIGTAFTDRIVIVPFYWDTSGSTRTVSSATIGGVAANIVAQNGGTGGGTAIIWAAVPTGTTATIVINFSANVLACDIAVYAADPVTNTPLDFATSGYATSSPSTAANVDVQPGGFCIAVHHLRTSNVTAKNWNGVDAETWDVDRLATAKASLRLIVGSVLTTETNSTRDWIFTQAAVAGRSTCAASWV
jgi:hypothetical protein